MRRIGAHLSISGGLAQAVERTVDIGGNAVQIFSSSPRMWLAQLPKKEEVEKFTSQCLKYDIRPVFIHAKYLINLASEKKKLVELSKKSLIHDMRAGELIKAEAVIVHLGSHLGQGFTAVKDQVVDSIKQILEASSGQTRLLIENSAGQKGKLCSRLEEIRLLLQAVDSPKLGWCFDTCHGFNAGYSLGKSWGNHLIQFDAVKEIKKLDLLKDLKCLHVNDSRDEFNSGHDRHENLGQGRMGLKLLKEYVNQPELNHLPLIIETPGFDKQGPDKKNLDILKSLIDEKNS